MATTSRSPADNEETIVNLSHLIDQELDFLEESFLEAKRRADQLIIQINEARRKSHQLRQREGEQRIQIQIELQELKKTVSKLKYKIPFNLITPSDDEQPNPHLNRRPRSTNPHKPTKPFDDEEDLAAQNLVLLDSHHLSDVDDHTKYFLRRFLAFPKRAIVKKSLLLYMLSSFSRFEPNRTINDLVSKGLFTPVYKKCSRTVCGFWMHPRVRYNLKNCFKIPLDIDEVILLNSADDDEDIIYSGSAKFSTMVSLEMLHLGKWQRSSTQHIEMVEPDLYFKYVKHMYWLTYISFRGVSMILELPKFITKLTRLEVLDLKACYNLEVIPSDIGNLWGYLTHLDMSECYFLDHMPPSLSRLINLRVLKGFFVGETNNIDECCTLQDLSSSLTFLMKLNIYTCLKTFPSEDHLAALEEFKKLLNLTISWGGCSTAAATEKDESSIERLFTHDLDPVVVVKQYSFRLEKLDLQCVPEKATRNWLRPSNFKHLERLYIRGGQFNDLGHIQEDQKLKGTAAAEEELWRVEILRLKHLSKLEMDWSELVYFFP